MSVPLELSARRGDQGLQLLQQPVDALEALRRMHHVQPALVLSDAEHTLPLMGGENRSIEVHLDLQACTAGSCGLLMRAADDTAGAATRVGYDADRGTVFIDRSRAGCTPPGDVLYPQRREAPAPPPRPGRG